ncbi:MAG: hypothetical protein L0220_16280, partial [Acidobacteria bacterium]|nr:hypothetical protein [Acidobacteriota bacterium]
MVVDTASQIARKANRLSRFIPRSEAALFSSFDCISITVNVLTLFGVPLSSGMIQIRPFFGVPLSSGMIQIRPTLFGVPLSSGMIQIRPLFGVPLSSGMIQIRHSFRLKAVLQTIFDTPSA